MNTRSLLEIEKLLVALNNNPNESIHTKYFTTMLFMSSIVYYPAEVALKILEKVGALKSVFYSNANAQALYMEFKDFDVVSFKGIGLSRADFGLLGRFEHADYLDFKVHSGFVKAIGSVRDNILHDLLERDPNKKLVYTGHSKGGALACLFSCLHSPTDLTTFGAPRIFDMNVPGHIFEKVNFTRVVTKHDFVKHLPFSFMGYRHVGKQITLPTKLEWNIFQSHSILQYVNLLIDDNIDIW